MTKPPPEGHWIGKLRPMTLAERLDWLGYGRPGNDLDATLHRVLDELGELRRIADALHGTAVHYAVSAQHDQAGVGIALRNQWGHCACSWCEELRALNKALHKAMPHGWALKHDLRFPKSTVPELP